MSEFRIRQEEFCLHRSPCWVGFVVRFCRRKILIWKANKGSRKCAGRKYILSEDLARAAELQVPSTVCRVHKDEIRRSSNRCSVPRENHLRGLRKQRIPGRLFAVLDAAGPTCDGYKPGARWCYKCWVDEETRFTLHPDKQVIGVTKSWKGQLIRPHVIIITCEGWEYLIEGFETKACCLFFFLRKVHAVSFKYLYFCKVYCAKGENQLEKKMNKSCKQ